MNNTAPFVCFTCRKQFDRHWDLKTDTLPCPECGNISFRYDPKFRIPARNNDAQWKKVEYLKDHGFYFQRVYDILPNGVLRYAKYPEGFRDAQEFVIKYKYWAEKR